MSAPIRKKLIEVSLPLDAINRASAREKSIRHGHPSTLHLWWARRPLAACRAVLFAQLVDDPSAWPDRFGTDEARRAERDRLHRLIEQLVKWESSTDEHILRQARWEIARSLAWARQEEPPPVEDGRAVLDFLAVHAPPVCDPFCGGGSIPLEAQRLGLRAVASDLNPVAVLITKALVEIPPKFAGTLPVHPAAQEEARLRGWRGIGASGLAEDVRRYGKWMRDEAFKRVGHLYPAAELPDGSRATVIAWIWARTVRSPNPVAKGAMVPLASTFLLSTKTGRELWLEPEIDREATTYRFLVRNGQDEQRLAAARHGTKTARGASFKCLLTGTPINDVFIKAEANAGRMGAVMMAMVVEKDNNRFYVPPPLEFSVDYSKFSDLEFPDAELSRDPRALTPIIYGMSRWIDFFTKRQLITLTTISELIEKLTEVIKNDATAAGMIDDGISISSGGQGATVYSEAVATYLSLAVGKMADRNSSMCVWETAMDRLRGTFNRPALQVVWDFAETNPFAGAGGDFLGCCKSLCEVLDKLAFATPGSVKQLAAQEFEEMLPTPVISSDPPYYDNIGYADISDFFYIWLRRSARKLYPALFRTIVTPKGNELVAASYRHGNRDRAEEFFLTQMRSVIENLKNINHLQFPMALYYAFKQSEQRGIEISSTGWATFLQAVHDAGLIVDGTWPLRTELSNRMRGQASNALASSIVLACRRRPSGATTATRSQFLAALRAELPEAIRIMQQEALAPVDLQQAAIGPGIGIFTRYRAVLESDDTPMPVRTALILINAELDSVLEEQEGEFDSATRFGVTWFGTYGFEERPFGDADNLSRARAVGTNTLIHSGLLSARAGKARLLRRHEIPFNPPLDAPHWVLTHALIHALLEHSETSAATLLTRLGAAGETCRDLAYRLFQVAERRKLAAEATDYNALVVAWPDLQKLASSMSDVNGPPQTALAV